MHNIEKHDFFKTVVIEDVKIISEGRNFSLSDIVLEDANFDEYEYYIHTTGFYLVHLIQLCDQLTYAVELISDFKYNPKIKTGSIDYLIYNVENYLIRLFSSKDRLLQLVNAVFHLCIDESQVGERVILNNLKVSRTELPKYFKNSQKIIQHHLGDRNTIVHKHSYLSKELKRLQIFMLIQLKIFI